MFLHPTTLILGAGASEPYGFPVGSELWNQVRCELPEVGRYCDVSPAFTQALQQRVKPSIDALIEAREEFEEAGKIAIAMALLPRETPAIISRDDWYHDFFHALTARGDGQPKRVTVVTFNYDRSLEYFLIEHYKTLLNVDENGAAKALNEAVEFIHVYGSLGRLSPHLDGNESGKVMPFNRWNRNSDTPKGLIAMEAAKAIHLIGREVKTQAAFDLAATRIASSKFVCFLGFGFLRENMARLKLRSCPQKFIFASGYGVTTGFRHVISSTLACDAKNSAASHHTIHIGARPHKARDFLNESAFFEAATRPNISPNKMVRRLNPPD